MILALLSSPPEGGLQVPYYAFSGDAAPNRTWKLTFGGDLVKTAFGARGGGPFSLERL